MTLRATTAPPGHPHMGDLLASSPSTGRSQVPTLPPPHTLLPPHMPVGAPLPLWVPPHPQPHVPLLGAGARKLRGPAPSQGAPSVARKEEAPRATRLQPPLSPCADTGDTRPRRRAIRETWESRSREIRTWQFGRCLAGSHREGASPRFTPGEARNRDRGKVGASRATSPPPRVT